MIVGMAVVVAWGMHYPDGLYLTTWKSHEAQEITRMEAGDTEAVDGEVRPHRQSYSDLPRSSLCDRYL